MKEPQITTINDQASDIYKRLVSNIEIAISGHAKSLRHLLAALVSGGHVLLEDYPGTGKTTLAKALSKSIGVEFKRVQFTPDLLPSDILGVSVFDQQQQVFNFRQGPIFTDILLADEINRASPRTQSALLEAMAEGQVSIEGETYPLSDLFFVIATQNPVEFRGTYPLPEAQMDRFAVQLSLGYVDLEQEIGIVTAQNSGHPLQRLQPCISPDELRYLKQQVQQVKVSPELLEYMARIVRATRTATSVQLGAGPRATLTLVKTAQALAVFDGLEMVVPDHVKELLVPVIAHRLMVDSRARFSGTTAAAIVQDLMQELPLPG